MTTITHQVSDDLLAGYVSGDLAEAFNLVIASHVSLCDEARARMEALEAIGGTVLEQVPEAQMAPDSFAATLALISGGDIRPRPKPVPQRDCPVLPAPIRDYVGGSLADVKWRPVGMGVKQAILATSPDASARLLYIPAGCEMPDHGHRGLEMTLVLQGAFLDGAERYARGDVDVADEEIDHTPIADVGEDCICIAASAAPLKFHGLVPRLVQPFLKI